MTTDPPENREQDTSASLLRPTATLYDKLDTTKRQSRLVRLLPKSEELINMELQVFSLDDEVEWEALSYLWGKDEAANPVLVGKSTVNAKPGLYDFLLHMYQEDRRGWSFIDALCINQQDAIERSSQVQLMGEIYRNAQRVIVWIHIDNDFLHLRRRPPLRSRQGEYHEKGPARLCRCLTDKSPVHLHELPSEDALQLVLSTAKSEYWTRLWIVQEVLLGGVLELRAGCVVFQVEGLLAPHQNLVQADHETETNPL